MPDQTQTPKGLLNSVTEYVSAKLKLSPSNSLNDSILKELKNISSLLGNAINKNPGVTGKSFKLPDAFKQFNANEKKKDSDKTNAEPDKKINRDSNQEDTQSNKRTNLTDQTLLERFQEYNRNKIKGAFSSIIPQSVKNIFKPQEELGKEPQSLDKPSLLERFQEYNRNKIKGAFSSIIPQSVKNIFKPQEEPNKELTLSDKQSDSSDKKQGILGTILTKLTSVLQTNKVNPQQGTPGLNAPKSLLEARTEVQKVELQNVQELSEKFSSAFKDYFKDINTNLKEIAKLLGSIDKKDSGGEGGSGGGLMGGGLSRLLKQGGGLARAGLSGLATLATTPIASMGTGAALATTAAGVAGGELIGGMAGQAIGSNETVSEALYGSKTAGKEAYEKYGTGIIGFTKASYDYAFGAGAEARRGQKETESKTEEMQKELNEKTTAVEQHYKKRGYNTLEEFGADVKAGKTEPVKWNKDAKKLEILPLITSKSNQDLNRKNSNTPPITPEPVKQAVAAAETPKAIETPATPKTEATNVEKPEQKFTPIAMDKVPEIAKESVSAAIEPQKPQEDKPTNVMGVLDHPDKRVNKEIADSSEYKNASEKLQYIRERLQFYKNSIMESNKRLQALPPESPASIPISPAPSTTSAIKPSEAPLKDDKNLKEIASNTNKTNDTLAGLTTGFHNLATALEKLGVSVAEKPPTTINNIAAGGQTRSEQGPSPIQLANSGNKDIFDFRIGIVEASRFKAA